MAVRLSENALSPNEFTSKVSILFVVLCNSFKMFDLVEALECGM